MFDIWISYICMMPGMQGWILVFFCSCSLTLDFQITLSKVSQIGLSNMGLDLYETVLGGENRTGTDCLVGLQLCIIWVTAVKENKALQWSPWLKYVAKRAHCFQILICQAYQYGNLLSKAQNRMTILGHTFFYNPELFFYNPGWIFSAGRVALKSLHVNRL